MAPDTLWALLRRRLAGRDGPISPPTTDPLILDAYGPAGTALLIECRPQEKGQTRTAIRSLLMGQGGRLGAPDAVAYLFNQVGLLRYPRGTDPAQLAQLAYAAGAEDVIPTRAGFEVLTDPDDLPAIRATLATRGAGEICDITMTRRAWQTVALAGDAARQMLQLLMALARRDDVTSVYCNAEIPDEIVAEL